MSERQPQQQPEPVCKTLEALRRKLQSFAATDSSAAAVLQVVVDECLDPVIVTDEQARITMVNGLAARLLGVSARDMKKLTLWDITHPNGLADFDVLWGAFLRAGRQRGRYGMRHSDSSLVEVSYCAEANVLPRHNVFVLRSG